MPTDAQVRGMLLEEAVLFLLSRAGYRTIRSVGTDQTLHRGASGMEVCGRGARHQIDAIADSVIHHPFSHPQRLLVEAKCFAPSEPVGIPIARGAVGVLKDVNEFWESRLGCGRKQRYHYQFALFSASGFTSDAERYAFAHDIYLFPVAESAFLRPVVQAIGSVTVPRRSVGRQPVQLKDLREWVRHVLQSRFDTNPQSFLPDPWRRRLQRFFAACSELRFALLTVFGSRFPVFLVPSPEVRRTALRKRYRVGIFRDDADSTWFLRDMESNIDLFSFDLPRRLFFEYATNNTLTDEAAVQLKEENMSRFFAMFHARGNGVQLINFELDNDWFSRLKERIAPTIEAEDTVP